MHFIGLISLLAAGLTSSAINPAILSDHRGDLLVEASPALSSISSVSEADKRSSPVSLSSVGTSSSAEGSPMSYSPFSITEANLHRIAEKIASIGVTEDTPAPIVDGSTDRDECPLGVIEWDMKPLARSTVSVIWNVRLLPRGDESKRMRLPEEPLVAKMVHNCGDLASGRTVADSDPLANEYRFLELLSETGGLVPKTYYLSPSAPMAFPAESDKRPRYLSNMLPNWEAVGKCIERGSSVRYMIQAKAGRSLEDYFIKLRPMVPPTEFVKAVIHALSVVVGMLKKLHGLGIEHGDIHAQNIMLRVPKDGPVDIADIGAPDSLVFIDFEMASFYPGKKKRSASSAALVPKRNPLFLSPWQLAGKESGPKDDVYRAVEMAAHLLSPRTQRARGAPVEGSIDVAVADLMERTIQTFERKEANQHRGPLTDDQVVDIQKQVSAWYKHHCHLFAYDIALGTECCEDVADQPRIQKYLEEG